MDRRELFEKFKRLGWKEADPQAISIFNFLMDAREQMGSNSILLDLGAGQCRYSFFFEHCYYLAIDFAKADSKWDYSRLDFIGDICRPLFFRDNSVDFCLNTTTLEHLSEPSLFFNEVRRILKPGGRLFLYVPFVIEEHQIPYDFFRYTSYGLRHLCKKSGLKVVSLKASNKPLYTGIRWAYMALVQAKGNNIVVKCLLKCLRGVFRFLFIPLFDRLDIYSTEDNFPQCWLLVAEKEGLSKETEHHYGSKKQAVESIICCPVCGGGLDYLGDSYVCSKCKKAHPVVDRQIIFSDST